jgi:hypothetical protein
MSDESVSDLLIMLKAAALRARAMDWASDRNNAADCERILEEACVLYGDDDRMVAAHCIREILLLIGVTVSLEDVAGVVPEAPGKMDRGPSPFSGVIAAICPKS